MRTVCIMFLFALALQGCGKKGPLYVPKTQPGPATSQNPDSRDASAKDAAQLPQPQPQSQPQPAASK